MEEIKDQEAELFGVVNRPKAAGQCAGGYVDAKANAANMKKETWYHLRCRIRAFWREAAEPAIGYIGLGGVMVAGMLLEKVPSYAAVPVALICFMWVAVRMDRFFRR